MRILFKKDYLHCKIGDTERFLEASCVVRNELNGWRKLHRKRDVVTAICQNPYEKPPVMPRPFPKGTWDVYKPLARTSPYLAPFFIPTSAEHYLDVWALDSEGGYDHATGEKVLDLGYGIHFSSSNTTVGCIKVHKEDDLLWLASMITENIESNHRVILEVIE